MYNRSVVGVINVRRVFVNNKVYWFTGLSGSGKSTIAEALYEWLPSPTVILDGDVLRKGLCSDLGFSVEDRNENIRRLAHLTRLMYINGMNVIVAFISPMREGRRFAKSLIGNSDFYEIYLSTSLEVCEKRDVKGLYAKARSGEIPDFTGIGSPYEEPLAPNFRFDTDRMTVKEIVMSLLVNTQSEFMKLAKEIFFDSVEETIYESFDSDKKTSLMIGRWQPLHDGHKMLIQKVMDEGNDVVVGIRNMPRDENNPFSAKDRIGMIKRAFGDRVKCIVIPEGRGGFEVIYGRKVGWTTREVRLDGDVEKISGTKTREALGVE